MPDGIVGANDGYFGNFLLGYNPNSSILGANISLPVSINGATSNPTGINIYLRSEGVGQSGLNVTIAGNLSQSSGINVSMVGYVPTGKSQLYATIFGSTSGYIYRTGGINVALSGRRPYATDQMNVTLIGNSLGTKNSYINVSIADAGGKYTSQLNASLFNESFIFKESLNISMP